MPPGLKNCSKTLQREKHHLYRKFSFVRTYQDDEKHLEHHKLLFTALHEAKFEINWSKCQIGLPQNVFAGYLVSEKGLTTSIKNAGHRRLSEA